MFSQPVLSAGHILVEGSLQLHMVYDQVCYIILVDF